jgi:hypothetical protein
MLRSQIEQRDLHAVGLYSGTKRQQFAHRIVQFHLVLLHHLRQYEARERLRNRNSSAL